MSEGVRSYVQGGRRCGLERTQSKGSATPTEAATGNNGIVSVSEAEEQRQRDAYGSRDTNDVLSEALEAVATFREEDARG